MCGWACRQALPAPVPRLAWPTTFQHLEPGRRGAGSGHHLSAPRPAPGCPDCIIVPQQCPLQGPVCCPRQRYLPEPAGGGLTCPAGSAVRRAQCAAPLSAGCPGAPSAPAAAAAVPVPLRSPPAHSTPLIPAPSMHLPAHHSGHYHCPVRQRPGPCYPLLTGYAAKVGPVPGCVAKGERGGR